MSHFCLRIAGCCLKSDLLISTITRRWLGRIWEGVTALAALPAGSLPGLGGRVPTCSNKKWLKKQDFQCTEHVLSVSVKVYSGFKVHTSLVLLLFWHSYCRGEKSQQKLQTGPRSFCNLLPARGSPRALYQTELIICIRAEHQMITVSNSLCKQCFTA